MQAEAGRVWPVSGTQMLSEIAGSEQVGELANLQPVSQEINYFDSNIIELVYPDDSDEESQSAPEFGNQNLLHGPGYIHRSGYENSQLEEGESMVPENCSANFDESDLQNPNDLAEDNHSFSGPINLKRRRFYQEIDNTPVGDANKQNILGNLAQMSTVPQQNRMIQVVAQDQQLHNSEQQSIHESFAQNQSCFSLQQIQSIASEHINEQNARNYTLAYEQYKNSISQLHPNFVIKSIPELIGEFNQRCQKINFLAQSNCHMNQNMSLQHLVQSLEHQFECDLERYTEHLNVLRNKSEDIPNYQRNLFDFEDGESLSSISSGSQFSQLQLSSAMSQSDGQNGQSHAQFPGTQLAGVNEQAHGAQSEHVMNYSQGHIERAGNSSTSNKSEQLWRKKDNYHLAQPSVFSHLQDANDELRYDIQYPSLFVKFIFIKIKLAQIEFEYMTQFQAFAMGYSTSFPLFSNSIRLYRQYRMSEQEIKTIVNTEFRVPNIMIQNESPMMLKESHGLIDTDQFFNMCPGQEGLHYQPRSKYKVLNQELHQVWQEFLQHIQNFRVNQQEFNALYVNSKQHYKRICTKKEELYSNLFFAISVTQIQLESSLRKYMDVHRLELMQKQNQRFSKDFISYMISLKNQHYQIIDSTMEMVEQFAFQHFELFDQTDYRRFLKQNLDMISRNFEISQSPYRYLREKSKRSILHKTTFVKYIWREILLKKREIILKKGPIEIIDQESAFSRPNQYRGKKNKVIKQQNVQEFYQEVLKLRWNYCTLKEDDIFKVSKQPKREQKRSSKLSKIKQKRMKTQRVRAQNSIGIDENQEERMEMNHCQHFSDQYLNVPIESAFDPLFSVNPRSQRYVKSPVLQNIDNMNTSVQIPPNPSAHPFADPDSDLQDLRQKYHDFLPQIPDILIEDFIYENNKYDQIRKNQALFKTIQDLPHLSVLEKNACYFISA